MMMDEQEFEVAPRFVFLGDSIVSDWRNPLATSTRAVVRALEEQGFETVYLEPRRNSATVGLMRQRGSGPLQLFNAMDPGIQYRTVDLPARYEIGPWIGQFAATSGVIVALEGTPEPIETGLAEFVETGVEILVERSEIDGNWGRTRVERIDRPEEAIGFRPAVLPQSWDGPRSGLVLVVYDDAELGRAVAERVPDARRIVSGSADLPDWEFVPEIELPPIYGAAKRVLVVDDGQRPIAPARVWLPRANGATTWGVAPEGDIDAAVAVGIDELGSVWERPAPELPERLDARWVARSLVDLFLYRSR